MGNANAREGGGGGVGVGGGGGGGGGGGRGAVGQHHHHHHHPHQHQHPSVGFHAAAADGQLQQQQQQRGGPSGHGNRAQTQAQVMRDQPRFEHAASTESMSQSPSGSPGSVARSPLTFIPQVPMMPISKLPGLTLREMAAVKRAQQQNYYQTCLYGEPEKGVATMIVWSYGGVHVGVIGSWDNWQVRQPLQRSGRDYTLIKVLPPGIYQYKFWVDGHWRYSPDLPAVSDGPNNVNNILDVQDYVPENLDSVAGFDPPRSPDSSYNDPLPGPEDFAKEPPSVPPQLHLTLLNVPQQNETSANLPRPQHVILNHLYVEKEKTNHSVLVLGTTNRFRSKYVTTVLYKPLI